MRSQSGFDIRRFNQAAGRASDMDRITQNLLGEFVKEYGLQQCKPDEKFEQFATFVAVRNHFPRSFLPSDLLTGGGSDTGIDAIAIIVNGVLVLDVDMVHELLEQNGSLEVAFVFVQAEQSASFSCDKIRSFGAGVVDFFSDAPLMPRNQSIIDAFEIMETVYAESASFSKKPKCHLYYITTGHWTEDQALVAAKKQVVTDIKKDKIFASVSLECIGADELQHRYTATKKSIKKEFFFKDKVELPEINGIDTAFIGVIPANDFVQLISTDVGDDIRSSIFVDNIRDWQDYNLVNSKMRDTLRAESAELFGLMNNGLTIIAKSIHPTRAGKVVIEDFQIVNGCQTSHVIFYERDQIKNKSVFIPVRIIATTNEDVINSIILATNSQTALKPEQIYALTDFAKKLEIFFPTYPANYRLYYERRDGQYDRHNEVEKTRVVNASIVIRSFASMFLSEPHRATKTFTGLREKVGEEIFAEGHKLDPYYAASFAYYRLEYLFRTQRLDPKYKPARYHILMAFRFLIDSAPLPWPNSREMEKRCRRIIEALWDPDEMLVMFDQGAERVEEAVRGEFKRDNIRLQSVTDAILKSFGVVRPEEGRQASRSESR